MPRAPRPALRLLTPLALALLLSLLGLPRLQQAFTYRVWFRASDPHLQAFDAFQETFGNDDVLACVVTLPEGVFSPRGVRTLQSLTERLGELPDVEKVSSLTTYDWIRDQREELRVDALLTDAPPGLAARAEVARTHELPRGYLVSEDLPTALVFLAKHRAGSFRDRG